MAVLSGKDLTTAKSYVEFFQLDYCKSEQLITEENDIFKVFKNAELHALNMSTHQKKQFLEDAVFYNTDFYHKSHLWFLYFFLATIRKTDLPDNTQMQLPVSTKAFVFFPQTLHNIENVCVNTQQMSSLSKILLCEPKYPVYWTKQCNLNRSVTYDFLLYRNGSWITVNAIICANPSRISREYIACSRQRPIHFMLKVQPEES